MTFVNVSLSGRSLRSPDGWSRRKAAIASCENVLCNWADSGDYLLRPNGAVSREKWTLLDGASQDGLSLNLSVGRAAGQIALTE
jgi:hypothetical protein